jgi:Xaa-Pro dipeptidase
MAPVPRSELERRRLGLQEGLREDGIDAALIVQPVDLYYFTGTLQQAHLIVPARGEPLLLVRRDLSRAREESQLLHIEPLDSLRALPDTLARLGVAPNVTLGLELDVLPVVHFRRYEALFPRAVLVDCSGAVREVRSVKSEFELALLAEAAVQTDGVLREAAAFIREGMTEIEVSAHLEATLRRLGHQGVVRFRAFGQEMVLAHIFAGPEAAVGSYMDAPLGGRGMTPAVAQGAGRRPIRRNEPIVLDVAGAADGYIVDQTRTLCLGNLAAEFREAYDACMTIQDLVRRTALPGTPCGDVYHAALTEATAFGYGEAFMGAAPNQVSFIGHGVGLEIDEMPFIARGASRRLATNNVVAVEPKLVFPGRGAVGVENTWRVMDDGLEPITTAPDHVWEM